jgi:hypothetical protein
MCVPLSKLQADWFPRIAMCQSVPPFRWRDEVQFIFSVTDALKYEKMCYAGGVSFVSLSLATFHCIWHALLASPFEMPSQVKRRGS